MEHRRLHGRGDGAFGGGRTSCRRSRERGGCGGCHGGDRRVEVGRACAQPWCAVRVRRAAHRGGVGGGYAVLVSVASMLAFNWFHLPPVHSFTLADSSNWAVLAVYLATAIVVSQLAARARRRAAEAEERQLEATLLADVPTSLLQGRQLETNSDASPIGRLRSSTSPPFASNSGPARESPETEAPLPLEVDGRVVGTIYTQAGDEPDLGVRRRFLPALGSLLAVASDRERLARDAFEAEALRRSDAVKTAVIQAVFA